MSLRILFMGTPDFSVPALEAIQAAGHKIEAVYTQPPRPGGARGLRTTLSPVHRTAERLGLHIRTPLSFKDAEEQENFRKFDADVAIVIAYGLLLPQYVLESTGFGCYNAHASLLPRWRGAAPIHRAIMTGDDETGVTIMKMEQGLDTGPIVMTEKTPIQENITTGQLHNKLMALSAKLLLKTLTHLEKGLLKPEPQKTKGVLYAKKIEKTETYVDWSKPAKEVHNHIRGLSPSPGAWCIMPYKEERVKLLRSMILPACGKPGMILDDELTIACGQGSVRLLELQRSGGKALLANEFLHGVTLRTGMMFPLTRSLENKKSC